MESGARGEVNVGSETLVSCAGIACASMGGTYEGVTEIGNRRWRVVIVLGCNLELRSTYRNSHWNRCRGGTTMIM